MRIGFKSLTTPPLFCKGAYDVKHSTAERNRNGSNRICNHLSYGVSCQHVHELDCTLGLIPVDYECVGWPLVRSYVFQWVLVMAPRNKRDGLPRLPQWVKPGEGKVAPKMLLGRPKGSKNKIAVELKVAIMEATAMVGRDGKGKDGLHGYLMRLAIQHPKVYARFLEKLIPMHIKIDDDNGNIERYETLEELQLALAARGLPTPANMIDVTPIASSTVQPKVNGKANGHHEED